MPNTELNAGVPVSEKDLLMVLDEDRRELMMDQACDSLLAAIETLANLTGQKYFFLYHVSNLMQPPYWETRIPARQGHMDPGEYDALRATLQWIWNREVYCACCDHDGALQLDEEAA